MKKKEIQVIKKLIRRQNKYKGWRKVDGVMIGLIESEVADLSNLMERLILTKELLLSFKTNVMTKKKHSCKDVQLLLKEMMKSQESIDGYTESLGAFCYVLLRNSYPDVIAAYNKEVDQREYVKSTKKAKSKKPDPAW